MAGLAAFVMLVMGGAGCARSDSLIVFAAASLQTALDQIATAFQDETGHSPVISYAGTSQLARQIQQGAPAEVFISANPVWMDILESDAILASGTRRNLVGNRLVLISHSPIPPHDITPDLPLAAMLDASHLALALTEAVPAGIYAKSALQSLGLWDQVADRVVQSDNVRSALHLVATGAAAFGIVYASDVIAQPGVTLVGTFPETAHPPITYPVGAINPPGPAALAFLDYLSGPRARGIFRAHGFTDPPE